MFKRFLATISVLLGAILLFLIATPVFILFDKPSEPIRRFIDKIYSLMIERPMDWARK